jgi:hypothetical protein
VNPLNTKQIKNFLRCRKEKLRRNKQNFKDAVDLFEINIAILEIEKLLYYMDHGIKPEIAEDAREKEIIGQFINKDEKSIAKIEQRNNSSK